MKTHFKLTPAAHLFLVKGDQVLLSRRFNTGYQDGNWSVPAGHIDGDEPASNAMIREIKEEIGLSVSVEALRMVYTMHRSGLDGGTGKEHERMDLFFEITEWEGEPVNCEPDKCDALTWFPLNALPKNTIPYIREAIEGYAKGRIYSEHGW